MRRHYMLSCAIAAILTGTGSAAIAADTTATTTTTTAPAQQGLEQVVVTAQRRRESVQKVPGTVQAISGRTLQNENVVSLEELLKFTPNVTFNNNGPGQGNIYMRGLSAGGAGNQSSATAGNFPNVAVYLDDQSMQFPARNADVYFVDMDRVEVLEGPQGTLFGGGAEAGALRYITNKPNLSEYQGRVEGMYGTTQGGDNNSSGNLMVNLPLVQDKFAVRAVLYNEDQGGYINNVPSTFTRSNNDLGNSYWNITPNASGLCPNGQPAGSKGLCAPPNSGQINNYAIAKKDSNPVTYNGFRLSAAYKVNEDWDALIEESFQSLDAEGLSQEYPIGSDFQTLKPLQNTVFNQPYEKDRFENTAWTLNGKLDDLKIIYTGAYMVRNISQQMDYINYSRTKGGMYYQCVGGKTGWAGAPYCYSPNSYWQDTVRNTHLTNEIRVSTPDTWRLRALGGVFEEQFKIYDDQNFNYKTIPDCSPANLAVALTGGPACVANVTTAATATSNHPGERSNSTAFGEDTQRGYDQIAFFGSADFDIIPDVLTISAGTRYFQYSEYEVGTQYATTTGCEDVLDGTCTAGQSNINDHHDKKVYRGFKSRANITWHIDPRTIAYYTFSQGFRPGGFNRTVSGVAKNADGVAQFEKPNGYAPDKLTNHEIGIKTSLLQNRLQLNFSAYYMLWDNVQFLFFNPTQLGNTTFGVNGPNYTVKGLEGQFAARVIDPLKVSGSFSLNDNTQSSSPCLKDNNPQTSNFGSCITEVNGLPFTNPFGSLNSTPAFSPKFEGNITARYEYQLHDYPAFLQGSANYVGSMYNEPATYESGSGVLIPNTTYLRYLQPAYVTFDGSIGIKIKQYDASIFATNIGNSHASTFTTSGQFIKAETPLRPRVVGLKISASF